MNFNHDTIQQLPLVLSVPQLAGILHIGRNSAYQLVNSGEIILERTSGFRSLLFWNIWKTPVRPDLHLRALVDILPYVSKHSSASHERGP